MMGTSVTSVLAAMFLVASVPASVRAGTAYIRDYGGFSLTLPDTDWGVVDRDMKGETNGVPDVTYILGNGDQEPTPVAYVGIVASTNDSAKLGNLDHWIEAYQLPAFVEFYREGGWIKELSRKVSETTIAAVPARRLDLLYEGALGKGNVTILSFTDPASRYRYAVFIYNVGVLADLAPVVALVERGASWR